MEFFCGEHLMTTTLPRKRLSNFGEFAPMERLFEGFFDFPWKSPVMGEAVPFTGFALDIEDKGDKYLLTVDLAGIKKEEVDIDIDQNLLTISVNQEEEKEEKEKNFLHRERRVLKARRTVTLPADAETEKSVAELKDGILHISVNKLPEAKAKKIQVK